MALLAVGTILSGCSSSGRYSMSNDVAPKQPISTSHIENAVPQYEPYSVSGNKDYTVLGHRYHIITDPQGFTQKGQASWYGKKFHGHKTSNGEVYDMYSMTAAHKTLPIPCYVEVRNLDNGKTAIVRVNDRGPFHQGRIIDLSYAAASKLGVIKTGTANVEIKFISVARPTEKHKTASLPTYAIQVASSSNEGRSKSLAKNLSDKLSVGSYINSNKGVYRIYLGPFKDYSSTQKALSKVKTLGYSTAFIRKQTMTR
ncbi:septal ring lytic transglycosylase RlpA family protein [Vibrio sp. S4M6]|nr:septal ring lytic transglycosylase RlpA family protein [Vibrio sinus]